MGTDIHGVFQARRGDAWEDVPSTWDQSRHYQLFAVLAGVRNGYGFAGVITGEPIAPIAKPRGFPSDWMEGDEHKCASEIPGGRRSIWREEDNEPSMWMGDHSYSWLTAAEILAWAETAPTVEKTGVLSAVDYGRWDEKSPPEIWSGGVSGPGVRVCSMTEAKQPFSTCTHVQVVWQRSLREELSYFFDEVARLASKHGEVRLVFGFDS